MSHIFPSDVDRSEIEVPVEVLRAELRRLSRIRPKGEPLVHNTDERYIYEYAYVEGRRDERRLWMRWLRDKIRR